MSESGTTETPASAGEGAVAAETPKGPVDLQALAERIYRLFREEAQLERERLGRPRP